MARPLLDWLRTPRGRGTLLFGGAAAAGTLVAFLLQPWTPRPTESDAVPPPATLLGAPLTTGPDALAVAQVRAERFLRSRVSLKLPDGEKVTFRLADLGAHLDEKRLAQLVRDLLDATSPLRRRWASLEKSGPLPLPTPIDLSADETLPKLRTLKDRVDRTAADARLDLAQKKLVPEVPGRRLDLFATYRALVEALSAGQLEVDVQSLEQRPQRVAADLAEVKVDEVLGWFETRYDRNVRYEARTFNLRLAASKLDGTVLLPGEVFDFNGVVGPRDEANGYKVAKVIADGEIVDGLGGGTCQISGTLHGAAQFAGLEIVERYAHTRPSSYIKMGMDATVVYPTINFRFRNNFPHPIVLHETVQDGVVRAELLGPRRTRTVTLIRKVDEILPFDEQERPEEKLPAGVRILAQRGVPGFRLRRYRLVQEGLHGERQQWKDTYPPTSQIVLRGTGPKTADRKAFQDDAHPEYVADELLTMVQGDNLEDQAQRLGKGEIREIREPGKSGTAGWYAEAGLPVWKADNKGEPTKDKKKSGKKGKR